MKTSTAIFESVAARTMTPEEGAEAILLVEAASRDNGRPAWMPRWLYAASNIIVDSVLAMVGLL
jgi:hypothetical protein